MLYKTEGIVLGSHKYSDRYSIAHVFTRDFGKISYMLPLTGSKKSKIRCSLFFPLSILNMEVEHLLSRDIQRLKSVELQLPLYEICTDMTKLSITFFISEFLTRVLPETDNSGSTFDYLKNSIETLEVTDRGVANFHIALLIGLTRHLGIYPGRETDGNKRYFDMLNGEFCSTPPSHPHYLNSRQSEYLTYLNRINYGNMHLYKMSRSDRRLILDNLIIYYRLHLYDFPKLKSIEILSEIV